MAVCHCDYDGNINYHFIFKRGFRYQATYLYVDYSCSVWINLYLAGLDNERVAEFK